MGGNMIKGSIYVLFFWGIVSLTLNSQIIQHRASQRIEQQRKKRIPSHQEPLSKVQLLVLHNNVFVRAFLDLISYAEGTFESRGYYRLFGNNWCDDLMEHPRQLFCGIVNGKELCTTAAGRYQMLARTFDWLAPYSQVNDFSPINQDCLAIQLLYLNHAVDYIRSGNILPAIRRVANIWPSLPGSIYNQGSKKVISDLEMFFKNRVAIYRQQKKVEGT
jgi:muramidase (phage lysozyme)